MCASTRGHTFSGAAKRPTSFICFAREESRSKSSHRSRPPITIATLEKDDVLGWSWVVEPYYWHLDARAVEPTRAIALDGKCLRTKCEENHDLGYELLKRFVHLVEKRLEATRLQLLDVYAPHR